jgi:hypothetical protein
MAAQLAAAQEGLSSISKWIIIDYFRKKFNEGFCD